jgi:hypothetical protein
VHELPESPHDALHVLSAAHRPLQHCGFALISPSQVDPFAPQHEPFTQVPEQHSLVVVQGLAASEQHAPFEQPPAQQSLAALQAPPGEAQLRTQVFDFASQTPLQQSVAASQTSSFGVQLSLQYPNVTCGGQVA